MIKGDSTSTYPSGLAKQSFIQALNNFDLILFILNKIFIVFISNIFNIYFAHILDDTIYYEVYAINC